jgi:Microcystin-dependent protein
MTGKRNKEDISLKKISNKQKIVIFMVVIMIMAAILPSRAVSVQAASTGEPVLGQISLFPYNAAPRGWVECDGRSMNRLQNQALFSLIGTTFGGDGTTKFNVPNLSNKAPITGTKYYMATMGMYGVDSANPAIGEVCLLPDSMVQRISAMWKLCDGSMLSVAEYSSLYSLIGVNYGGNGSTNFNIPNLSTKSPISGLHYYIAVDGVFPTESGIENETLLGSIELYAFSFAPGGTYYCNGQKIPTNYNDALYSLIGTKFGGDGSNFGVPNLIFNTPSFKMKYYMRSMGLYPSFN